MSTLAAGSIALPLDSDQTARLHAAVDGLNPAQMQWVSGYIAGLAANSLSAPTSTLAATTAPSADASERLHILYGSQTGNGERVALALKRAAEDQGFPVSTTSLADFKPAALKRESLVTFVISTHGEGDPPDDAELFHEYLLSKKAPPLNDLKYAVFALGDSSYVNFCQTGREFDTRLAELGASRLLDIVECDVDFDAEASAWTAAVTAALPELLTAANSAPVLRAVETEARYGKEHPFSAEVLVNQKITGAGSSKDVRHLELSLEGSGLDYAPGDSLAVMAQNPPRLVAELMKLLGLDAAESVDIEGDRLALEQALTTRLEITAPSLSFLKAWAAHARSAELDALLEPGAVDALASLFATHQVIDVLRRFPASVGAQAFVDSLRRLAARSYSIASSPAANPDEAHLTVGVVRYEAFGSLHEGAASTWLADRVGEGESVSVWIEPNPRFRLPAADDAPVIMIGPGTGVAPFRAFVEERRERGAAGRNWLFFGDRTLRDDFLYQLEWQRYRKEGLLTRLDVAFSRDQAEKVYVQDRIREQGADLYTWLEEGAHVYVCGDATQMAGDVHDALVDVIATHGGIDPDAAEARLKTMKREGRYQKDVY